MRITLLAVGVAFLVVACGSSTTSGGANGGADGGDSDAGCGAPPAEQCTDTCNGETSTSPKDCVNGAWVCPPVILCPTEAGPNAGDGGIACGATTCHAATEYCQIAGGGVAPLDGGATLSYSCPSLPSMPCDAGTGCACIPDKCNCTDDGGYITNECLYP
ncbi:MAG: hypothetical protein ACLQVI_18465 [Polyangiaceae bacterium]